MELGDISTASSLLGKIIRLVFIFIIIGFFAFEVHLISLGFLDLLGIDHMFQIDSSSLISKGYNRFLKIINTMISNSGKIGVLGIIFLILSIYYLKNFKTLFIAILIIGGTNIKIYFLYPFFLMFLFSKFFTPK